MFIQIIMPTLVQSSLLTLFDFNMAFQFNYNMTSGQCDLLSSSGSNLNALSVTGPKVCGQSNEILGNLLIHSFIQSVIFSVMILIIENTSNFSCIRNLSKYVKKLNLNVCYLLESSVQPKHQSR